VNSTEQEIQENLAGAETQDLMPVMTQMLGMGPVVVETADLLK